MPNIIFHALEELGIFRRPRDIKEVLQVAKELVPLEHCALLSCHAKFYVSYYDFLDSEDQKITSHALRLGALFIALVSTFNLYDKLRGKKPHNCFLAMWTTLITSTIGSYVLSTNFDIDNRTASLLSCICLMFWLHDVNSTIDMIDAEPILRAHDENVRAENENGEIRFVGIDEVEEVQGEDGANVVAQEEMKAPAHLISALPLPATLDNDIAVIKTDIQKMLDDEKISPLMRSQLGLLADRIEKFELTYCGLSLGIPDDPVTLPESGHTYGRAELQQYIASGGRTCPKTQALLVASLYELPAPNVLLKDKYRTKVKKWEGELEAIKSEENHKPRMSLR